MVHMPRRSGKLRAEREVSDGIGEDHGWPIYLNPALIRERVTAEAPSGDIDLQWGGLRQSPPVGPPGPIRDRLAPTSTPSLSARRGLRVSASPSFRVRLYDGGLRRRPAVPLDDLGGDLAKLAVLPL